MADIFPFRGIVYNTEKIPDLSAVIIPPYDQFGPEQGQVFYNRHENNMVRIIGTHLGLEKENAAQDPYALSAERFKQWLEDRVLIQDDEPAIYAYHQDYIVGFTEQKIRKGFMAITRLEDYSPETVMPHEQTFSGPKKDRLQLIESCQAAFGHIMLLYDDPQCEIDQLLDTQCMGTPDFRVIDDLSILHMVWRVKDPKVIAQVQAVMKEKSLMIADGHHRYEAARQYRDACRKAGNHYEEPESPNQILATFLNLHQGDAISLLPTHRLIHGLPRFDVADFKRRAAFLFHMYEYQAPTMQEDFIEDLRFEGYDSQCIGFHAKGSNEFLLLRLKDPDAVKRYFLPGTPEVLRHIDSAVLHQVILAKLLELKQDANISKHVTYQRHVETAITRLNEEDFQCAFLLNPPKVEQVFAVASAGQLMPQKSTDFYPKLLTGLASLKYHRLD